MSLKSLTGWGTYSSSQTIEYKGFYLHFTLFTDNCGISYWRWFSSLNRLVKDKGSLWVDKNSKGRKLETRYYLDKDEALAAAKSSIDK